MDEAKDMHRDLYVGVVAEEMAQKGYYGDEVTCYAFLADGALFHYDDAQECAEAYVLALAAGAEVTLIKQARRHCAKKRSAREATRSALVDALAAALGAEPLPFVRRDVDLRPLRDYTKSLGPARTRTQDAAIVGIMTLPTFAMKPQEREAVLDVKKSFDAPVENRHFFGYLEKQDGLWQSALNGTLSVILEKWCAAAMRGPVSPILPMHLESRAPIYKLRGDFERLLADTMDADYLAMLDALYASQK